jgi:hypothetical protein
VYPGVALDERLRSVAVVHVPVDDQHPLDTTSLPRVMRGNGDIAKETETHRLVLQGMMSGRTDRTEALRSPPVQRPIDTIEDTSNGRCRRRK